MKKRLVQGDVISRCMIAMLRPFGTSKTYEDDMFSLFSLSSSLMVNRISDQSLLNNFCYVLIFAVVAGLVGLV